MSCLIWTSPICYEGEECEKFKMITYKWKSKMHPLASKAGALDHSATH